MNMTRAAQAALFEDAGVQGAALELLLRATAPARHQGRVEATLLAAAVPPPEVAAWHPDVVPAIQAARILADLIGIGGPAVEALGAGTTRLACFSGLGKGRRQASDGPAWMAAAEGALASLQTEGRDLFVRATQDADEDGDPLPTGGVLVQLGEGGPAIELDVLVEEGAIHPAFGQALCLHGLRLAAGLPVRADVPGRWTGCLAACSAAFNRASDALRRHVLHATRVEHVLAEARDKGTWQGEVLAWAEDHREESLARMCTVWPEPVQWLRGAGILS